MPFDLPPVAEAASPETDGASPGSPPEEAPGEETVATEATSDRPLPDFLSKSLEARKEEEDAFLDLQFIDLMNNPIGVLKMEDEAGIDAEGVDVRFVSGPVEVDVDTEIEDGQIRLRVRVDNDDTDTTTKVSLVLNI